jgi:hypothetical protein
VEPDAWLDSLRDDNGKQTGKLASTPEQRGEATREVENDYDSWTKEQLYSKLLLPLVSDTETVVQAVRRYGKLVQKKKPKKKNGVTTASSSSSF